MGTHTEERLKDGLPDVIGAISAGTLEASTSGQTRKYGWATVAVSSAAAALAVVALTSALVYVSRSTTADTEQATAASEMSSSADVASFDSIGLDVFSGRPNPSWELLPDEAASLEDVVSNLPASPDAQDPPAVLGFRAVFVSSEATGYRATFDGEQVVLTGPDDTVLHLADPGGVAMRTASRIVASKQDASSYRDYLAPWTD